MPGDEVVLITALRFAQPKTGGERYYHEIIEYLKKRSVNIYFLPRSRFRLPVLKNYLSCNINFIVHFLALWWGRGELRHKRVVVLEDGYDRPRQFLFNFFLKLFPAVRIVIVFQDVEHHLIQSGVMRFVDRYTLRRFLNSASCVAVPSQAMANEAIRDYDVEPQRVQIVPAGVDKIKSDASAIVARNDNTIHLLFVGTCLPVKGIEYLLRAIPLLDPNSVLLHIVGQIDDDPAYFQMLQQIMKEYSLEGRVIFYGRQEGKSLWEFYRQADIFVLPSLYETYSIVLMEAMQFGLPIVATRTLATPEKVIDNYNGILVPPRDSKALAEAVNCLANDHELRRRYGENGYKIVGQAPSWDEVGERLYTFLTEFARKGGSLMEKQGMQPSELDLHERLKRAYNLVPKHAGRVLDLGGELSEIGALPIQLAKKCDHVHVVNISESSVREMQNITSPNIGLSVADTAHLPYRSEAFDTIILTDVLEHVCDEEGTIHEVHRALVPGGTLIISVPHRGLFTFLDPMNVKVDIYPIYRFLLDTMNRVRGGNIKIAKRASIPRHRHYSLEQLLSLFGTKFIVIDVYRSGFLVYPFCDLIRNICEKLGILRSVQAVMHSLMNLDYQVQCGSLSYNMMIHAIKVPS